MSTPIQPDKYARAVGFDPFDFVEAVQAGEDDYSGVPIGAWRQQDPNGGVYLAVPDDHAREIGFSPDSTTGSGQRGAIQQRENPSERGLEAVADAAPPTTANAGAAYVAGKFADTVQERPEIMGDFVDGAAFLGSCGLAYATAEEGDVLKAGATAAGTYAAYKGLRMGFEWLTRRLEERKREQRHEMQQERQQMKANDHQRRSVGDGHHRGALRLEGTR
jgi:hypothetical protein